MRLSSLVVVVVVVLALVDAAPPGTSHPPCRKRRSQRHVTPAATSSQGDTCPPHPAFESPFQWENLSRGGVLHPLPRYDFAYNLPDAFGLWFVIARILYLVLYRPSVSSFRNAIALGVFLMTYLGLFRMRHPDRTVFEHRKFGLFVLNVVMAFASLWNILMLEAFPYNVYGTVISSVVLKFYLTLLWRLFRDLHRPEPRSSPVF